MIFRLACLFCFLFLSNISYAQLTIKGTVLSENPVKASVHIQGEKVEHDMYLYKKSDIEVGGKTVRRTRYDLPWAIVKDRNYTLRFTDGDIQKVMFVHGAVPSDIIPKQKYIIDIDLTQKDNADIMIVVFWSKIANAFLAMPMTERDEIMRHSYDPSIWQ
jgi:hypothetical protein